jgi:hypothetical protein
MPVETLIALSYVCAYTGSATESVAQVRRLLQAKMEQCDNEVMKHYALFALSLLSNEPMQPAVGQRLADFDVAEFLRSFDGYSLSMRIAQTAHLAHMAELTCNTTRYSDIEKIYNLIILRSFDHVPEAVSIDDNEDAFEVDYGKLVVDLSDMDLLNLVAINRYLMLNNPAGFEPEQTLSVVAELEHRAQIGDETAEVILQWHSDYIERQCQIYFQN